MERTVLLVDMDCFYVQVEQRLQPQYIGKPCAVVQYNDYKGGGLIAVGYEARAYGVTRGGMRGADAKKLCPDIHLFQVPVERGKANLTRYREACVEVMEVLCKFAQCVERASVDEAYIDITEEVEKRLLSLERISADQLPNTHVVGYDNTDGESGLDPRLVGLTSWLDNIYDGEDMTVHDKRLAVGALFAEEIRLAVYEETGFRCSAGIGHNKTLAKLACGIHKPNQQTVLPQSSVPDLFKTIKISKVRGFGGKLGKSFMETQGMQFMADLCGFSEKQLQANLGDKTGAWVYNVCRGLDYEPVTARQLPKSLGCGKNFPGKECLDTKEKVQNRLKDLSEELEERLIKDRESNKRTAKSLSVCASYTSNPTPASTSKTCALVKYSAEKIASDAYSLLQKINVSGSHQSSWSPPIICLAISATKFEEDGKDGSKISTMFSKMSKMGTQSQSNTPVKVSNRSATETDNSFKLSPQKGSIKSFFKKHVTQADNGSSTLGCSQLDSSSSGKISNTQESPQNKVKGIQSFFRKHSKVINPSVDGGDKICGDNALSVRSCITNASVVISDENSSSLDSMDCQIDDHAKAVKTKRKGFFARKQQLHNSPLGFQGDLQKNCSNILPDVEKTLINAPGICSVEFVQEESSGIPDVTSVAAENNVSSDTSKSLSLNTDDGNSTAEWSDSCEKRRTVKSIPGIDFEVFIDLPEFLQDEIMADLTKAQQEALKSYRNLKKTEKDSNELNIQIEVQNRFEEVCVYTDECSNVSISDIDSRTNDGAISDFRTDTVRCNECGKEIPFEEERQHSDYHFALEIQKQGMYRTVEHCEQTKKAVSTSDKPNRSAKHKLGGGSSKRKSSGQLTGCDKKTKVDDERTLHSFFTNKNGLH